MVRFLARDAKIYREELPAGVLPPPKSLVCEGVTDGIADLLARSSCTLIVQFLLCFREETAAKVSSDY